MRSEAQFFKTLMMVFLAFYLSSLIVFFFFIIIDKIGYDIYALMIPFTLGMPFTLSFSPILIVVTFIQWWVQNIKVKNFFSFILIIVYGFVLFIYGFELFNNRIIIFFLMSLPSTLLFLLVLSCLMKFFTRKIKA